MRPTSSRQPDRHPLSTLGFGLVPEARAWSITPMEKPYFRPPGGGNEETFLKKCIHCGQCAQVCPYGSISLFPGGDPIQNGTPRIHPSEVPCYLCMRCPPVCPSGALEDVPIEKANMGFALLHKDECYTYQGTIICRTCFEKCPLRNSALILVKGQLPVITEACVGCGVCEYVCPKKAISTVPARQLLHSEK